MKKINSSLIYIQFKVQTNQVFFNPSILYDPQPRLLYMVFIILYSGQLGLIGTIIKRRLFSTKKQFVPMYTVKTQVQLLKKAIIYSGVHWFLFTKKGCVLWFAIHTWWVLPVQQHYWCNNIIDIQNCTSKKSIPEYYIRKVNYIPILQWVQPFIHTPSFMG